MPQEVFPFPEYEQDVNKISDYYLSMKQQIERYILTLLELPQSASTVEQIRQQQLVLRRVTAVYEGFREEVISTTIPAVLLNAYLSGVALTLYELGSFPSIEKARDSINIKDPIFKASHDYKIHKLVTDTQRDLLQATNNTEESVKSLIRQVVSQAIRNKAGVNYGNLEYEREIKKELNKALLQEKINQSEIAIIDKAGRRWRMGTYVNLIAKTKLMVAHLEAVQSEGQSRGIDLGIISTHPLTTDACLNFQGMIVSLNGQTPGYPSIRELRATGLIFHPNCRHHVRPVRNLSLVPKDQLAKHKKLLEKYEKSKQAV